MRHKTGLLLKLMRLHKPIGIWLLLFPTLWALWIASNGQPDIKNLAMLIIGTIIMRSAGCIINDIADRKFDGFVKRTASRPLVTGEITLISAVILFCVLIIIAFIIVLNLNFLVFKLSVFALFLACLYPFTKRKFSCPQLFLGAAFAMGVPIAFAAQNYTLRPVFIMLLLYSMSVLWPLIYDTQYAMADREEDIQINLKSTAILFGKYDLLILKLLQIIMLFLLILLGLILNFKIIYFVSISLSAVLFLYQNYLCSNRKPDQCFKAFLNNQWIGLIVFIGLFIPHAGVYWDKAKHFLQ